MARDGRPDEFALIATLFRPLTDGSPAALSLEDDAAVVPVTPGSELVVTTDTIVGGVHFRDADPPDAIGRKALRVNLSDLAAMGAAPLYYLLNVAIPDSLDLQWLTAFADGLARDQAAFGITLIGGDTTRTPGPLTISITAMGQVPAGAALRRSGAEAGDAVFVTGTLGDAALALAFPDAGLTERYLLPQPRLEFGAGLIGTADATADVSDGLIADLGHICAASGVGAEIRAAALPLSLETADLIARDADLLMLAATGGDDYELVFTVPPDRRQMVSMLAADQGVAATEIGRIVAGQGVRLLDKAGDPIPVERAGYTHF